MADWHNFLLGVLVTAGAVCGLFFLRFWRRAHDRLFGMFAAAFFLLSLNWLLLAARPWDESQVPYLYLVRLLAFVIILVGIIDKNRSRPTA